MTYKAPAGGRDEGPRVTPLLYETLNLPLLFILFRYYQLKIYIKQKKILLKGGGGEAKERGEKRLEAYRKP